MLSFLPFMGLLLLVQAVFAGSETLVVACDREGLREAASAGSRGARLLERMLERPDRLLWTAMVGTNLALVLNVTLLTFVLRVHGATLEIALALGLGAPLILFCGEVLPRTLFEHKAQTLAPAVSYLLWGASKVFAPLLWLLARSPGGLFRRAPKNNGEEEGALERDELKLLLRMSQQDSDLLIEERKMVDRLIDLSDRKVHEVMIPLIDVVAVPETASWEEAVSLIVRKGHSRLPVFRDRVLQIVGILHHFDLLLASDRAGVIRERMRPAFYVPETKQVFELLLFMKKSGNSMAIAVDEYGAAAGIITVEDILEEIVGEIEDEYDPKRFLYQRIGPSSYMVDARIEIDHLNERFSLGLADGDYETLGGFLMTRMGRVPAEGERYREEKVSFTVERASPRSLDKVRMDIF